MEDDGWDTAYPELREAPAAQRTPAPARSDDDDCDLRPGEMSVYRDDADEPVWLFRMIQS